MRSTASDALIVIALSGQSHLTLTLALAAKARRSAAARSPPRRPLDHASNIASKESNQWHG
jgi:DNA-binding MurR/RpiR family transcriptional regulator